MDNGILLIAHEAHSFTDYEHGSKEYMIAAGHTMEVPEAIGVTVANVHRNKICVLERIEDAEGHSCSVSERLAKEESKREVDHEMIEESPMDKAMHNEGRLSAQRRRKLRQAKRRSRTVRLKYS
tara:strand:- start:850 stop:1221 length:372 start_codon:yes stop_codon:yes gene_type:complete